MKLSITDFHVLDALDSCDITTQRQLSEKSGISLGHVNFLLKSLLKRGLVKMGNFSKSPNKMGYAYYLTPEGIEAKSKLKEYSRLERKIVEKLVLIESRGHVNIVFIGPKIVKDFVDKIIKENAMNLAIVNHCNELKKLKEYNADNYDIALIMDGNNITRETAAENLKPFQNKLLPLW